MEDNLKKVLRDFAEDIKKEVEEGLSQGIYQPEINYSFRWKLDDVEYTDGVITKSRASQEQIENKSWNAATFKIFNDIINSSNYVSVIEMLYDLLGKKINLFLFERFTQILILNLLIDIKFIEKGLDQFIIIFLKEIKGEPLGFGAEVHLNGIVIQSQKIEFNIGDVNYILRQTTQKDLEKDIQGNNFPSTPLSEKYTAILNINFIGRNANDLQKKVEQAIAVLRLYNIGSVRNISYKTYSESILNPLAFATVTIDKHYSTIEKYVIKDENIKDLKDFFHNIISVLPRNFYEPGINKLDHVDLSYNRYNDALFFNGIIEKRIANTVMGFESLYLEGGQELSFRLRLRIAKLFGLIGYDPYKIKRIVKDAYKLRSSFVHGGQLSNKDKTKIEEKYGNLNSFLHLILEYLRISIIIWIFINKKKGELIGMIDASLIDNKKEEQLINLIKPIKSFISKN